MKTPTKFVKPLTPEQCDQLHEVMKSAAPHRTRTRAHAILLSHRHYPIDQIADIFQVDRDRVSQWLDWWEEDLFDGLDDDPRSGRPPTLNDTEKKQAVEIVNHEPRSIRQGLARLADEIGKVISRDTLKNILTAEHYVWKRLRRGLRSLRDEAEFRATAAELALLRADALRPDRAFDLWYFDEAGFTLQPSIPYAWQPVGERLELAATHGRRQNVLGFFNLQHKFHSFAFEGRIDTHTVIHCFDLFSRRRKKPALVVIDNAPIHTSEEFEEEIARWAKEEELYIKYLPSYSPELNLIEILWRKIKYDWLPLNAYQNFKTMTEALFEIIRGIGSKYRITFA
jgi:transposase